jgi:hypothetical protein
MDDDDFQDLFSGGDALVVSSQESLTNAAANLDFCESDNEDISGAATPGTSLGPNRDYRTPEAPSVSPFASQQLEEPAGQSKAPVETSHSETESSKESLHAVGPQAGVIQRIEEAFEGVANSALTRQREASLTLKTRGKTTDSQNKSGTNAHTPVKTRRICFPGKNEEEAWRFGESC